MIVCASLGIEYICSKSKGGSVASGGAFLERFDDRLFGELVEQLAEVIVLLDEKAIVQFVSPSVHRKLGYTNAQLVGRNGYDVIHPGDRRKAKEALEFALDNPEIPVSVEFRLVRRDGGDLTFEAVAKKIDCDSGMRGIVVTLRDITDRLASAAELRAVSRVREVMNSLLRLMLQDLTLDALLHSGLDIVLGSDFEFLDRRGAVFLADGSERNLILQGQTGMPTGFFGACEKVAFDRCSCWEAVRRAEALVIDGFGSAHSECPKLCPRTRLVVPIMAGQTALGVLVVGVHDSGPKSALEREFFASAADVLAGMIRRHRAEEENARLSSIVREYPNPVLECDSSGDVTYENPAVKKLAWQYSVDVSQLLPANHVEIVSQAIATGENATRRAESAVGGRVFGWTYHPVHALGKVHVFGRDITDRRRAEEQLRHGAMYDQLTGLPNRSLVMDRITRGIEMAKKRGGPSFAVVIFDLDRFKVITESLGHAAGDTVLVEIAERLREFMGGGNTIGRLGGDEFAAMLTDTRSATEAVEIARQITDRLGEPFHVQGHALELSASAGIVLSEPGYARAEEMLRDADTAMYRAKSLGSGHHAVFDDAMHKSAVERLRAQTDLRSAIDKGELTVFYQPVFALKDLRVRGFEALVRWRHPTLGTILPGKFISVAEETGLIVQLGDQVLQSVCVQLARWKETRMPLAWVSVNLAAQQFQRDDIIPRIVELIENAGVEGRRLLLEITEGTAAQDPERVMRTMTALRNHGIRIALDDFGTGYSSMSYLKRFPIDALKIDRSFVRDLPESQDDAAIASSVIAMSHALGLKVVAEGVENERQALYLRSLDCDEVQGFLYGKPMSAEQATALLQHGSCRTEKSAGQ